MLAAAKKKIFELFATNGLIATAEHIDAFLKLSTVNP